MPPLLPALSNRSTELETIDRPDVGDKKLQSVYACRETMERFSGLRDAALSFVRRAVRKTPETKTVTVLDLFCGRGHRALDLVNWGRRRGVDIRVLGADRYGRVIDWARDVAGDERRAIFDVRDWNHSSFLQAQQFDFVLCVAGLHRMDDASLVSFLKRIDLLAKRGVFVGDWHRDLRAIAALKVIGLAQGGQTYSDEAWRTVCKGFTKGEILELSRQAGLDALTYSSNLGVWWSLSGERGLVLEPRLAPELIPG